MRTGSVPPPKPKMSIGEQINIADKGMDELQNRVCRIADAIRGAQPTASGQISGNPNCLSDSIGSLCGKILSTHETISSIESALGI